MPRLSLLVPTLPSRLTTHYPRIMVELLRQIDRAQPGEVELLGLFDNKLHSVGVKRNMLLSLATGDYLSFIDDDDRVTAHYLERLLQTIAVHPDADVIVYEVQCTVDGLATKHCRYGIELGYTDVNGEWTGKPAHTMVWRRELVQGIRFKDMGLGEDVEWVARATPLVKRQVRIDEVLYYYDFNRATSETADP